MDPQKDGTKHLNVTHSAKTQFGRMLSPPYEASFELSDSGEFQSVGGYWCWLLSGRKDKFREVSGEACLTESEFPGKQQTVASEPFQRKILRASWHKIRQNQTIFWRFEQNVLPFRRYYVGEGTIYKPSDAEWICDGLEVMSEYIDQNFW